MSKEWQLIWNDGHQAVIVRCQECFAAFGMVANSGKLEAPPADCPVCRLNNEVGLLLQTVVREAQSE